MSSCRSRRCLGARGADAGSCRYRLSIRLKDEPDSKQWLDRVSFGYQFNSAISAAFGTRKILGTYQPFAFAPFGPAGVYTPVAVDATNLSAALHYFHGGNELYVVYGDPGQLANVPALHGKWIRYRRRQRFVGSSDYNLVPA